MAGIGSDTKDVGVTKPEEGEATPQDRRKRAAERARALTEHHLDVVRSERPLSPAMRERLKRRMHARD